MIAIFSVETAEVASSVMAEVLSTCYLSTFQHSTSCQLSKGEWYEHEKLHKVELERVKRVETELSEEQVNNV